jgi:adenylosuccinate lyase
VGALPLDALTAVSSIDGRYRATVAPLAEYFSEFALQRGRIVVECEYLIALSKTPKTGVRRFSDAEARMLRKISDISLEDAHAIKEIEKETNHDVKAIEYFIKQKLAGTSLEDISERVHFALTSEDVNSVAYAFSLREGLEMVMLPALEGVRQELLSLAKREAKTAMLARTHGQSASPTTFGKEMRVFAERLARQIEMLKKAPILVKWGGATGNYNAHVVAAPEVDWLRFAKRFVESLNTEPSGKKHPVRIALNEVTTQIEPHDTYAELFDTLRRANTILIDFSQDMWRYISDGWVVQKPKAGETGSSTMPHKVNPIDFENAEGNLGVANTLFEHFSRKLPVSRLQRDLSDSTVERVFGTALAHSLIAYKALQRGLGKIRVNRLAMRDALDAHPEVIAEALQTALRAEGVAVPYEKLKELTRGKKVTLKDFEKFVDILEVSAEMKRNLKAIRPSNYTGIASRLARE